MKIIPASFENTIPSKAQIYIKPEWAQPHQLAKYFGVSRMTLYRYIEEMKVRPEFKRTVVKLNQRLVLVHIKSFEKFIIDYKKYEGERLNDGE